ncbi:MAG: PAAR domain-containing protein, partial [Gammaproteobacteria bacterium]|nr:PAAR domain-containing protein [Gammaproteobacteria bacterium]
MGKPAARMGDSTAHGGVVTVGCPTVLIGGQPAARIGDMHMCPMLNPGTPPPPHVGGAISLGSPMVLIGGMPAARMGDMAICMGPPDTIVGGCATVLIGEGPGSGGGGG